MTGVLRQDPAAVLWRAIAEHANGNYRGLWEMNPAHKTDPEEGCEECARLYQQLRDLVKGAR